MNEAKKPIGLDMVEGEAQAKSRQSVDYVLSVKATETLVAKAEKLGGFSVRVVAVAGDPYRVISSREHGKVIKRLNLEVPEDKVIISAVNTGNRKTPTNLSDLYK